MAEPAGRAAEENAQTETKPTQYLVLREERVRLQAESDDPQQETGYEAVGEVFKTFVPIRDAKGKVRIFEARTTDAAIEQYTGTGENTKTGRYKTVAWTNWKGVEVIDPPQPVLTPQRSRVADE